MGPHMSSRIWICLNLKGALHFEIASHVFKLQIASSLKLLHFDTSHKMDTRPNEER